MKDPLLVFLCPDKGTWCHERYENEDQQVKQGNASRQRNCQKERRGHERNRQEHPSYQMGVLLTPKIK